MSDPTATPQALAGLKVIDLATLFAGPMAATMLGDYGAEVIKVEHPKGGDAVRRHGHSKDGVPLWWKVDARKPKLRAGADSATVTCTPARANTKAATRPTGPAPEIITCA